MPFALDDDPDWAAGVALARTSCGRIAASVMKDGWAYALDANNGEYPHAQFPATVPPADVPVPGERRARPRGYGL